MHAALNSLTSPGMVAATLACLARGGALAEIGKRDVWSPARVAQERPDIAYRLVAIDFLPLPVRADGTGLGLRSTPILPQFHFDDSYSEALRMSNLHEHERPLPAAQAARQRPARYTGCV